MVGLLRVSGKRTLSKMNMFDFVITIAFGSVLASMLISKNVTLAQGVTAFAVLIGMQFAVTYTSVRFHWFEAIVKGEPTLLFYKGRWFEKQMREQRVSRDEMFGAARAQGLGGMDEVAAIVLETNGDLSVVKADALGDLTTLPPGGEHAIESVNGKD